MKTIYCFGTSNTSGCGFEFTSKGKWNKIPSVYNDIPDVNMNQKFFSWPGQLQLLSENIKVVNMAKSKVGQEFVIRTAFDLIKKLSKKELENSIFLFEFGGVGNKEVYLNLLSDYINVNYKYESDDYKNIPKLVDSELHNEIIQSLKKSIVLEGLSKEYLYDNKKLNELFNTHREQIESFIRNTCNMDVETKHNKMYQKMFESYLDELGISYMFVDKIKWNTPHGKSPFQYSKYKETISYETGEFVKDNHNNFATNKYIAGYIFNNLINQRFLNEKAINIEYPYL